MYRVERNDKVGRYAVATNDLEAGEQVLTETPVIIGPKSNSPVLCLGCYVPVDGSVLCAKCAWPLCCLECGENPYHKEAECELFSSATVCFQPQEDPTMPSPQYECITPLRLLLTKEKDPNRWKEEVEKMESHDAARKETPDWETEQVNIVDFLLKKCNLQNRFSEDEIHTACGILEVNCFEVRMLNSTFVRGLYPQTAIMSHNCVANTTHSIYPGDNYRISVRTTVSVKAGEELFSSYTSSLLPTMIRRENLKHSKHFDCCCARCADPTEMGTHFSSLKCTKCENGLIMSSNPLEPEAIWKCTHCEFNVRGEGIRKIYTLIQSEINYLENDTEPEQLIVATEKLMKKYKSVLHPRHGFNISLKHSLIQLYGRAPGYTFEDLPDLLLERKIDMCRMVLEVADKVEPGLNRFRGLLLYEMHVPMMLFARSRYEYKEFNKEVFCTKMQEVASVLREAVNILTLEDPNSLEGSIGQAGKVSLEQLEESINQL